eukprot:scaffold17994_cov19-Tisochrysis_lutea.AAC.1
MQWPLILENIFSIAGAMLVVQIPLHSIRVIILGFQAMSHRVSYLLRWTLSNHNVQQKNGGDFAENLYIQLSYPAFLFLLQGGWCGAIYLAFRKQSQGAALPASAALPNGLDIDTLCPPNMSATLAKMRMNGKSISDFPSMNFSGSVSGSVQRGSVSGKLSGKFGDSNLGSIGGSGNYAVLEASGWWLFLQTLLYIPSTPQEMHELILENMSIAFMSLNLGYVVILKYCLQAFSCFDFEGTKYMYFNADELCYTPEHFQIMTAAAAGLIVYIAGTWFMFITVMR